MTIRAYAPYRAEEILPLYESAGWTNYTERPAMLAEAYRNSLCALGAYAGARLAGVIRAVGDGVSVLFIQDLLVHPDFQRRGVGTALVRALLERYPDVYQTQLLTDCTETSARFYRSLGFVRAAEKGCEAFLRLGPGF